MVTLTGAKVQVVIGADSSQAEKEMQSFSQRIQTFGRNSAIAGSLLSLGLTAPIAGLAKAAIKTGIDYQTSMNIFQATTQATAGQMAAASKLAIQLGADLSLPKTSATDASAAMTELAKAGLSINDVFGAAKGTLQLAAAGALSEADAARITANQLNAFNLAGDQATRVADLLAAAANASSAEVTDLASSATYLAPVWNAAGQSIDTMIAALAEMANAGTRGSQAGTALRQVMVSLESPTKSARTEMQNLGINIYDASGQMLPFRSIVDQFTTSMKGMSDEQKNAALNTIFTTRGLTAANEVLLAGADAWDKNYAAVTRAGAAADLANARMKGLGGALEALKSQVQTVLLEGILPFLDGMATAVRAMANLVPLLLKVPQPILKMAAAFALVLATLGPLLLLISTVTVTLGVLISGPVVGLVVGLAALVATLAGSASAWRLFRDAVLTAEQALTGHWQDDAAHILLVHRAVGLVATALRGTFLTAFRTAHDAIVSFRQALAGEWIDNSKILTIDRAFGNLGLAVRFVISALSDISRIGHVASGTMLGYSGTLKTVVNVLAEFLNTASAVAIAVGTAISHNFGGFLGVVGTVIAAVAGLNLGFSALVKVLAVATVPVLSALGSVLATLVPIGAGVGGVVTAVVGAFSGLLGVVPSVSGLFGIFSGVIGTLLEPFVLLAGSGKEVAGVLKVLSTATEGGLSAFGALGAAVAEFGAAISTVFGAIVTGALPLLSAGLAELAGIGDLFATIFGGLIVGAVEALGGALSFLSPLLLIVRTVLTSVAIQAGTFLAGALGSLVGVIESALVVVGEFAGGFVSFLLPVFETVGTAATALVGFFGEVAAGASILIEGFLGLASAAGSVLAGLAPVAEFLSGLASAVFGPVLAVLGAVGTAFAGLAGVVLDVVLPAIGTLIGVASAVAAPFFVIGLALAALVGLFFTDWKAIGQAVFPVVGGLLNALDDLNGGLKQVALILFQGFKDNGFAGFIDSLGAAARQAGDTFKTFGADILAALGSVDWGTVGAELLAGFQKGFDLVFGTALDIGGWLLRMLVGIDWGAIGSALLSGFQTALAAVGNVTVDFGSWILGWLGKVNWGAVGTALVAGFRIATVAIVNTVVDLTSTVVTWMQSVNWGAVASSLSSGLQSAVNSISQGLNLGDLFGSSTTAGPGQGLQNITTQLAPLSALVQTVRDAFSSLADILGSRLQPTFDIWKASILEIVQNAGPQLTQLWAQMQAAIAALTPVLEVIAVIVGTILLVALNSIAAVLGAVLPSAITVAVDILSIFLQSITTLATVVTDVFQVIIDLVTLQWGQAWTDAKSVVVDLVTGVLGILGTLWDGVQALIQGLVDGVIALFTSLYHDVVGGSIIPDMVNGIISWISSLPGSVLGIISGFVASILGYFSALPGQIAGAIATVVSTVVGVFTNMSTQAVQTVQNLATTMISLGGTVIQNLASGITGAIGAVTTAAGSVVAGIKGAFTGAVGWLEGAGRDVVQGLINGIGSMVTQAIGAAENVASGVIHAITRHGQSPWPVMVASGIDVVQGLVLGMTKEGVEALKAAEELAKGVIDTIQAGLDLSRSLALGVPDINLDVVSKLGALADAAITAIQPIAARFDKDFTAQLKSMGDAIKGAFGGLAAAVDLAKALTDQTIVLPTHDLINQLKDMADWAVQALSDSANAFGADGLGSAQAFGAALKDVFGGLAEAVKFVQTIADGGVILPTHDTINQLKDMADWAVRALSDSAAVYQGDLTDAAKRFGDAMQDAFKGLAAAVDFVRALMKGSIVLPTASVINQIKDMADIAVRALSDSANFFGSDGLNAAKDFGAAMEDAFKGLAAAVTFIRDLSDNGIILPGAEVIQGLVGFASDAVTAMGTVAAQFDGTFVANAKTFGAAVAAAFKGLQEVVTLAQDIAKDDLVLPLHDAIDAMVALAAYAVTQMGNAAATMKSDFVDKTGDIGKAIDNAFGGLKAVVDFVQELAKGSVFIPFTYVIDQLVDLAEYAVTAIGKAGEQLSSNFVAGATKLGNGIKAAFAGLTDVVKLLADVKALGTVSLPTGLLQSLSDFAVAAITTLSEAADQVDGPALAASQKYADAVKSLFDSLGSVLDVLKAGAEAKLNTNIGGVVVRATQNLLTSLSQASELVSGPALDQASQYAAQISQLYQAIAPAIQGIAQLATVKPVRNDLKEVLVNATKALTEALGAMNGEAQHALTEAQTLAKTMAAVQGTVAAAGISLAFTGANINFSGSALFGIDGTGSGSGGGTTSSGRAGGRTAVSAAGGFHASAGGGQASGGLQVPGPQHVGYQVSPTPHFGGLEQTLVWNVDSVEVARISSRGLARKVNIGLGSVPGVS